MKTIQAVYNSLLSTSLRQTPQRPPPHVNCKEMSGFRGLPMTMHTQVTAHKELFLAVWHVHSKRPVVISSSSGRQSCGKGRQAINQQLLLYIVSIHMSILCNTVDLEIFIVKIFGGLYKPQK